MADNDPVTFTRRSARDIAETVRDYRKRNERVFLEEDNPDDTIPAHPIEWGTLQAALNSGNEVTMVCATREIKVRDPNLPALKRWPANKKAVAGFNFATGQWWIIQVWSCPEDIPA